MSILNASVSSEQRMIFPAARNVLLNKSAACPLVSDGKFYDFGCREVHSLTPVSITQRQLICFCRNSTSAEDFEVLSDALLNSFS